MKELHQQYMQIQYMPLIELFKHIEIQEEAVSAMNEDMEEAKNNMKTRGSKFKVNS